MIDPISDRSLKVNAQLIDIHMATTTKNNERIVSLDYLRALACFLVVLGHICFLGLNGWEALSALVPGLSANIFGPDAIQRNWFSVPSIWIGVNLGINVGALGVGIFFLISGFVITQALDREKPLEFIIKRVIRIYPTLAVAILLTALATEIYANYVGSTSPHSISSMIGSIFTVNGYLHQVDTLPVLWTLEVEMIFYVTIAILAVFGATKAWQIVGLQLFCCAVTFFSYSRIYYSYIPSELADGIYHFGFNPFQLSFILLGAVIYRVMQVTSSESMVYVLASLGIYLVNVWGVGAIVGRSLGGIDVINALWAIGLFFSTLWFGMRWQGALPLLFFAKISYPLYLVHVPIGWLSLSYLALNGWGMAEATVATWMLIILLAWLLHITIEKRSISFGKWIASKISLQSATRG